MENSDIAIVAISVSAVIILLTLVLGPVYAPNVPEEALLKLSIFNLPGSVSNAYNISPDSIAAYAVWGFIASIAALIIDFLMFLGLKGR